MWSGLGLGSEPRQNRLGAFMASDGSTPALIANFKDNSYYLPDLGPELVTNGTFDTDTTGWTQLFGTVSWSAGGLRATSASGNNGRAQQTLSLTPGKTYAISYNVTALSGATGGQVYVTPQSNSTSQAIASDQTNGTGLKNFYFTAVTSTMYVILLTSSASSGDYAEFDNVSVREVLLGDVGPELITNGNFASGTGWTLNQPGTSTATISGGTLNLTGDGVNAASADQSFTTEVGATYTVVYQLVVGTAASILVGTSQGGQQVYTFTNSANGWATNSFVATATTTWVRFQRIGAVLTQIDNVSIRKWTARPTLRSATFSEMFTYTASSTVARTYIDASGVMRNDLAANQPRFTWGNGKRQLLLENATWNYAPNGDCAGAVVGTPGTRPTNWQPFASVVGVTQSITGAGVNGQGIPYIEITYAGTAGASGSLIMDPMIPLAVAGVSGQTWTYSLYAAVVSGEITPSRSFNFGIVERSGAGTALVLDYGSISLTPSAVLTRYTKTRTLNNASTTNVQGVFRIDNLQIGDVVNIVIRVGAVQLEQNQAATSYIPTSGSAVNRAIETCQFSALALAVIGRPAISGAVQAQGYRAGTSVTDVPVYWGNSGSRWFAGSRAATTARSSDGSTTVDVTPMASYPTVPFRHAFTFNSSGSRIAINNTISSAAATLTTATMTRTLSYIGRAETTSGPVPGDGYYDNAVLYPTRISDAATQALGVVMS